MKLIIIVRTLVLSAKGESSVTTVSQEDIKKLIVEQLDNTKDIDLLDLIYKLLLSEC